MKYLKSYKLFENNSENLKVYHGINKKTGYEYIAILDGEIVKGFATNGYRDSDMLKNNIYAIGTIYGKGMGYLLYDGFISYFGKILPTTNESDQAKTSWKKKFENPKYIKTKIEGIGHYDRYPEEDFLNYIYDVKDKINVYEIDDLENSKEIYEQLDRLHKNIDKELTKNKSNLYTKGQSRERDNLIINQRKNPFKASY